MANATELHVLRGGATSFELQALRVEAGTPFDDGIVGAEETGTIVLPRAEAERLVSAFLGDETNVIARLTTATPLQVRTTP